MSSLPRPPGRLLVKKPRSFSPSNMIPKSSEALFRGERMFSIWPQVFSPVFSARKMSIPPMPMWPLEAK
jgi:hypothetical protein